MAEPPGKSRPGPHAVVLSWRDAANPDGGGSEVFLAEVTAGLVEHGWRVTQFSAAFPGAARDEERGGVRVVRRGGRLTVFLHALVWHRLGRFGAHDVVVDVQNGMPFLSPLVTRRPVAVLVHHLHREQWPIIFGPVLGRLGWWVESWFAVRAYARCEYLAVSQHTRRELVALGVDRERVRVVHNGTRPPAATGPRTAHPSVCVLGRLVPHKRVELALRAVAELRPELPDLTLDVLGAGDWEPQLRRVAADLGLADAVTFHGRVEAPTRDRLLAAAWVLAMPSMKEGWGLAVMEAAAQRTPAIGFRRAGGLAESIVDDVTGLLVEDGAGFVEGLRRLLTDGALRGRLGEAALARTTRYSWEETAVAMARALRRVGGRPAAAARDGGPLSAVAASRRSS